MRRARRFTATHKTRPRCQVRAATNTHRLLLDHAGSAVPATVHTPGHRCEIASTPGSVRLVLAATHGHTQPVTSHAPKVVLRTGWDALLPAARVNAPAGTLHGDHQPADGASVSRDIRGSSAWDPADPRTRRGTRPRGSTRTAPHDDVRWSGRAFRGGRAAVGHRASAWAVGLPTPPARVTSRSPENVLELLSHVRGSGCRSATVEAAPVGRSPTRPSGDRSSRFRWTPLPGGGTLRCRFSQRAGPRVRAGGPDRCRRVGAAGLHCPPVRGM